MATRVASERRTRERGKADSGGVPHSPPRLSKWAVGVAIVVLVAMGSGYRVLAWRLERAPDGRTFPVGLLAELPVEVSGWDGQDAPLDASVLRMAEVDDAVNRVYLPPAGYSPVGLYVALGVRARDLMPHRPDVCYPGAGWTLRASETLTVDLPDGTTLPVQLYRFAPGGLDGREMIVLNYYVVDNEACADVSLLRSKAWRGQGSIREMAQVQITCRGGAGRTNSEAIESVQAFAAVIAPPLRDLLLQAKESGVSAGGGQ